MMGTNCTLLTTNSPSDWPTLVALSCSSMVLAGSIHVFVVFAFTKSLLMPVSGVIGPRLLPSTFDVCRYGVIWLACVVFQSTVVLSGARCTLVSSSMGPDDVLHLSCAGPQTLEVVTVFPKAVAVGLKA